MNCKNNNTKLRRLPAEETQRECARCLLARGSFSVVPYDVCRGPGKPYISWATQLHRFFIAKLTCTSPAADSGVSASPGSRQPAHLALPHPQGQLLNGGPSKDTAGSGGRGNISCMWQHRHHTHSDARLKSSLQFQPKLFAEVALGCCGALRFLYTPDSCKHLNSIQASSIQPISNHR